jgi:hypothetical protein
VVRAVRSLDDVEVENVSDRWLPHGRSLPSFPMGSCAPSTSSPACSIAEGPRPPLPLPPKRPSRRASRVAPTTPRREVTRRSRLGARPPTAPMNGAAGGSDLRYAATRCPAARGRVCRCLAGVRL